MADFYTIKEGRARLVTAANSFSLDLSTKTAEEIGASATYAGGFGKITGTGYAAKTVTGTPSGAEGKVEFSKATWETGAATDWPAAVKSAVLRDGEKLVCVWNLIAGGAARALNAAKTVENFTGSVSIS